MNIAVDFDDTLTEESPFPITGKIREDEIKRLLMLKKQGHKIILWTGRKNRYLREAIELCNKNGLVFDDIVKDKFVADVYIDSKAFKSVEEFVNVQSKENT